MSNLPAPSVSASPVPADAAGLDRPPVSRSNRARTVDAAVVSARRLTRRFDDVEVIHPLDLDIEAGTILGLIGPSGCGKTTTVRLLTGLLAPTTGTATVFGRPATELTSGDRRRLGYLSQTPALFPDLSLHENLSFHASMYGLPLRRRRRLDEVLGWVELESHRRKQVADASGGMQRRLALAAAFVHDPDVVFLDEPTAGIDPILREKLWARFRESAAEGKTLIVTTQYVGEAGHCDQVGLLSEGELLLVDTPAALRHEAFRGDVIDVRLERPMSDHELDRLAAHRVVHEVMRVGATGVRVVVDDAAATMAAVRDAVVDAGGQVLEIEEHVVDYDEAFVRIVERHRLQAAERASEVEA